MILLFSASVANKTVQAFLLDRNIYITWWPKFQKFYNFCEKCENKESLSTFQILFDRNFILHTSIWCTK